MEAGGERANHFAATTRPVNYVSGNFSVVREGRLWRKAALREGTFSTHLKYSVTFIQRWISNTLHKRQGSRSGVL